MITLQTNYGPITIELDFVNAPKTSKNFLDYAQSKFYDGTIFHRVIKNFMIQGGGFTQDMQQKSTRSEIENEGSKNQLNKRGTLAMARRTDPHSASSQFFINLVDNDFLNFSAKTEKGWGYCVFGKVTSGMDIVDQIAKVATTSRSGHNDVPIENIVIEQVIVHELEPVE